MTVDTWDPALAGIALSFVITWLMVMLILGGLPAAWLASVRGRGPFLWLMVGVLLGPLAVLLVGFAPLGTSGRWGQCRRCKSSVRRGALACPYCGADASGYLG